MRAGAVGLLARTDIDGHACAVARRSCVRRLRRCDRVLQPGIRRDRAGPASGSRARPGECTRPTRTPDRLPPARARDRRLACRKHRRGLRVRAGRSDVRHLGGGRELDAVPAAATARSGASIAAGDTRGVRVRPRPRLALGDARLGRVRVSGIHGPDRSPAAIRCQERSRRERLRPGSGVRRRWPGRNPQCHHLRRPRTATAQHHLHVPRLDRWPRCRSPATGSRRRAGN